MTPNSGWMILGRKSLLCNKSIIKAQDHLSLFQIKSWQKMEGREMPQFCSYNKSDGSLHWLGKFLLDIKQKHCEDQIFCKSISLLQDVPICEVTAGLKVGIWSADGAQAGVAGVSDIELSLVCHFQHHHLQLHHNHHLHYHHFHHHHVDIICSYGRRQWYRAISSSTTTAIIISIYSYHHLQLRQVSMILPWYLTAS